MSDKPENEKSGDLEANEIIAALESAAGANATGGPPARAVAVVGYLGTFGEADTALRIYPELHLGKCFVISRADLLHHVPGADAGQPTKFYVRATAQITVIHSSESSFLAGSIASSNQLCAPTSIPEVAACPGEPVLPLPTTGFTCLTIIICG